MKIKKNKIYYTIKIKNKKRERLEILFENILIILLKIYTYINIYDNIKRKE